MMKFLVKGQRIEIVEREVIASGQIAFVTLKFAFDQSWRTLHKVVQFTQDDEHFHRVLGVDGLSCFLPSELHAGAVRMTVVGYDSEADTTVRATAVPVTLHIRPSGFCAEDVAAPPDMYVTGKLRIMPALSVDSIYSSLSAVFSAIAVSISRS